MPFSFIPLFTYIWYINAYLPASYQLFFTEERLTYQMPSKVYDEITYA